MQDPLTLAYAHGITAKNAKRNRLFSENASGMLNQRVEKSTEIKE